MDDAKGGARMTQTNYVSELNKLLDAFCVQVDGGFWYPYDKDILKQIEGMSPITIGDSAEPLLILLGKMVLWLGADRQDDG